MAHNLVEERFQLKLQKENKRIGVIGPLREEIDIVGIEIDIAEEIVTTVEGEITTMTTHLLVEADVMIMMIIRQEEEMIMMIAAIGEMIEKEEAVTIKNHSFPVDNISIFSLT